MGDVVDIGAKFHEAAPVEVKPRDYLACQHKHTMLDEKLRTIGCRDCGEERLDPFEVLVSLARQWGRWKHEAEGLRKLNAEYQENERAKWDRSRDRHLNAHPDHRAAFDAAIAALGDPSRRPLGYSSREFPCSTCSRVFFRFDSRWIVRRAPEPPSGQLAP
jgi:hypothetical protein